MSLKITPYPTVSGMQRALDYSSTGIQIDAKYIGVGRGLQQITLDDAGRAVQDSMKTPVAWLPILSAKRVSGNQHQLTIDMAGLSDTEWNFSELVLGDSDKNAIAIYGNASTGLMTVSPLVDSALVSINMVLATLPAGSINIIHQGAPIELLTVADVLAMHNAVGTMSLARMRAHLVSDKDKSERLLAEEVQQQKISNLGVELDQLKSLLSDLTSSHHKQVITTHNAVGTLVNTQMKQMIGVLN